MLCYNKTMIDLDSRLAILLVATAVIFTIIGFSIGYVIGRRTKNPVKFAIKFTALQTVGIVLFVVYNRYLTANPDTFVNLGILALIGGETVGMLVTRGNDKIIDKLAQREQKK